MTNEFDAFRLYAAMDAQRTERGLNWRQAAAEIWDQSSVLNERRAVRWNLPALAEGLDARRRERGLTWKQLATELRCTEHQVTGIRTARFAIGMRLAMRIVQWLERPAADFIHAAAW